LASERDTAYNEKLSANILRWVMPIVVVVVVVAAIFVVAIPFAISTQTVRDRLEGEIAAWTGHDVMLGDTPEVSYWPVPTILMRDVTVRPNGGSGGDSSSEAIMHADGIEAEFSLLTALTGRPNFHDFRLMRPVFTVQIDDDGHTNWRSSGGVLAQMIDAVASATDGNAAPAVNGQSTPGSVVIENGMLRVRGGPSERNETLSAIEGRISWPRMGGPLQAELRSILRGEAVRLVAGADQPLRLLAGLAGDLDLQFSSDLLTLAFDGTAQFSGIPAFSGRLTTTSPSARRALQWSGTEIKPGEAIGALSIDAMLQTEGRQVRLDDLILGFDGNRGIGALDLQWPEATPPIVSGTLAFNTLDVGTFLRAFTPLPTDGDTLAATIDTRFLREIGLDLRLSAQTGNVGPLALSNLAAAARIEQGRAYFDIGDASAYGGNLLGRIEISEQGFNGGGELRLSAQNVNFGAIYDAMGLTGPLPRGVGSLNIALRSPNPIWATGTRDIQGKFDAQLANGSIAGFDLAQFRALSASERFFDLGRAAGNGMAFQNAAFEMSFANGVANVTRGDIVSDTHTLTLNGLIPYERGSLAMAGTLAVRTAEPPPPPSGDNSAATPAAPITPAAEPPLQFFVGGSWPTPVISPILPR
jgi:AsmA protein